MQRCLAVAGVSEHSQWLINRVRVYFSLPPVAGAPEEVNAKLLEAERLWVWQRQFVDDAFAKADKNEFSKWAAILSCGAEDGIQLVQAAVISPEAKELLLSRGVVFDYRQGRVTSFWAPCALLEGLWLYHGNPRRDGIVCMAHEKDHYGVWSGCGEALPQYSPAAGVGALYLSERRRKKA
jgi:hypothetical protein